MWKNAYLSIKNLKASRALKHALDPHHKLLASLAWLRFATSATFGLRTWSPPWPNPGSAPDRRENGCKKQENRTRNNKQTLKLFVAGAQISETKQKQWKYTRIQSCSILSKPSLYWQSFALLLVLLGHGLNPELYFYNTKEKDCLS